MLWSVLRAKWSKQYQVCGSVFLWKILFPVLPATMDLLVRLLLLQNSWDENMVWIFSFYKLREMYLLGLYAYYQITQNYQMCITGTFCRCKGVSIFHAHLMQSLSQLSPVTLQMSSVNALQSFSRPISHLCGWTQAKSVFQFSLPGIREPQRNLSFLYHRGDGIFLEGELQWVSLISLNLGLR